MGLRSQTGAMLNLSKDHHFLDETAGKETRSNWQHMARSEATLGRYTVHGVRLGELDDLSGVRNRCQS